MTNKTDADRLAVLEKRVGEMNTLLHFQDSKRVEIEKAIGAIDQQLIKTDAGLYQVRHLLAPKAKKKKAKPAVKAKAAIKAKAKKKKK
jgi:metal-dependent HD superfamily phosphatase/phosphodiesterase